MSRRREGRDLPEIVAKLFERARADFPEPWSRTGGRPHLDLIARRKGYWRATPSLTQMPPREE
jgi:hypothetical protein